MAHCVGVHSATSLPALTECSCGAALTTIHIQTVAPPIPKPAVSGTSVKVTVSLLRGGGLGGEEPHLPVSLDGILRGSGSESQERCEEMEEVQRLGGGGGE